MGDPPSEGGALQRPQPRPPRPHLCIQKVLAGQREGLGQTRSTSRPGAETHRRHRPPPALVLIPRMLWGHLLRWSQLVTEAPLLTGTPTPPGSSESLGGSRPPQTSRMGFVPGSWGQAEGDAGAKLGGKTAADVGSRDPGPPLPAQEALRTNLSPPGVRTCWRGPRGKGLSRQLVQPSLEMLTRNSPSLCGPQSPQVSRRGLAPTFKFFLVLTLL